LALLVDVAEPVRNRAAGVLLTVWAASGAGAEAAQRLAVHGTFAPPVQARAHVLVAKAAYEAVAFEQALAACDAALALLPPADLGRRAPLELRILVMEAAGLPAPVIDAWLIECGKDDAAAVAVSAERAGWDQQRRAASDQRQGLEAALEEVP
jgi:hypothetical protein